MCNLERHVDINNRRRVRHPEFTTIIKETQRVAQGIIFIKTWSIRCASNGAQSRANLDDVLPQ